MLNPLPVIKMALPAIINYWKPIAICLIALIIGMKIYAWGGASVQADWNAAETLRTANLNAERDAAQKHAAGIAAEFADFQRKARAGMFINRKELANEIAKNAALRDCNTSPDFLRLYEAASTGDSVLPHN